MHLIAMFSRSEVIVRTNKRTEKEKQTDNKIKQTDAVENIHLASLRYAGGYKCRTHAKCN